MSTRAIAPAENGDVQMTIVEHLEELRDRLIVTAVALFVSTAFSLIFTEWLLNVLVNLAPEHVELIVVQPTERFTVYMKVALIAGVALAMPVILYEIVRYLLPALTREERRYVFFLVPMGTLSFIAGLAFAVRIVLPTAIGFLDRWGGEWARTSWMLDHYISFVTTVMFWMGIIFELPLVMFFLAKLRIVNTRKLTGFFRYWIVVAAVIAAMVTPTPDPVNMMIVMIPLVALYLVGIGLTKLAEGGRV
jgi:sec-independent protein translocase protein TatC